MPIIEIKVVKGRDRETLGRCMKRVAECVAEELGAPLESIRVITVEVEPELFAVGTRLKSE
ncbi:tautomerase family protein [Paeniglutamicibacter sp.]|uniref:tautomerase family protein n=1 Tax=Paeniglutamicibacter sp. TaxID=1934391 RepID=UPI00398A26B0